VVRGGPEVEADIDPGLGFDHQIADMLLLGCKKHPKISQHRIPALRNIPSKTGIEFPKQFLHKGAFEDGEWQVAFNDMSNR